MTRYLERESSSGTGRIHVAVFPDGYEDWADFYLAAPDLYACKEVDADAVSSRDPLSYDREEFPDLPFFIFGTLLGAVYQDIIMGGIEDGLTPDEMKGIVEFTEQLDEITGDETLSAASIHGAPLPDLRELAQDSGNLLPVLEFFFPAHPYRVWNRWKELAAVPDCYLPLAKAAADAGVSMAEFSELANALEGPNTAWKAGVPLTDIFA